MSAPLIAVTATTEMVKGVLHVRVDDAYLAAVAAAGALPVVLAPLADPGLAGLALDNVAGLVLTGGEDVGPGRYGESAHALTQAPNTRRDGWELALARAAREHRMPTLAICRGAQVMNVALGGTLVQDVPSEWRDAIAHDPDDARDARVHEALVVPGSRLAAALGTTELRVNSFHHQALARLAPGLRATAHAPDGVIEGVEAEDAWWMLGVQWHPEELVRTPEPWDRTLFRAFVEAARGVSSPSATASRRAPGA